MQRDDPVDPSESCAFAYAGEGACGFDSQRWSIASATVTGPAHETRGRRCDDAAAAATLNNWLAAVVCDGAGSAERGGEGAARAASEIVTSIRQILAEKPRNLQLRTLVEQSLEYARNEIVGWAKGHELPPRAVATTVVGVVCRGCRGVMFHLGDGTGIVLSKSLAVQAISLGTPKEYANETHFLTDTTWKDNLLLIPLQSVDRILLMTDGVTPFAVEANQPKLSFVEPIARFLLQYPAQTGAAALKRLLNKDEARRQVPDDKTVLWAGRIVTQEERI